MDQLKQTIAFYFNKIGSQKDFCDKHGFRRATISDLLSGGRNSRLQTLVKVMEILKLKILPELPETLKPVKEVQDAAGNFYMVGKNAKSIFLGGQYAVIELENLEMKIKQI